MDYRCTFIDSKGNRCELGCAGDNMFKKPYCPAHIKDTHDLWIFCNRGTCPNWIKRYGQLDYCRTCHPNGSETYQCGNHETFESFYVLQQQCLDPTCNNKRINNSKFCKDHIDKNKRDISAQSLCSVWDCVQHIKVDGTFTCGGHKLEDISDVLADEKKPRCLAVTDGIQCADEPERFSNVYGPYCEEHESIHHANWDICHVPGNNLCEKWIKDRKKCPCRGGTKENLFLGGDHEHGQSIVDGVIEERKRTVKADEIPFTAEVQLSPPDTSEYIFDVCCPCCGVLKRWSCQIERPTPFICQCDFSGQITFLMDHIAGDNTPNKIVYYRMMIEELLARPYFPEKKEA